MKLVCIGDSLTFGYGVPANDNWVSLIKEPLQMEVLNKGANGDTTSGMLSRSYEDVIKNHPNYVLIMGGSNDFMSNRPLNMVTDNIALIVKDAVNSDIIPIIGIEPAINKGIAIKRWDDILNYDRINELQKDYRNWIITFCSENKFHYIDYYKCFLEKLKDTSANHLFIDGLHPSLSGHRLMAECTINFFKSSV
ncbi:GDSL-type esterase/lipase family protein [Clostridium sp. WLY-B-L2]|jgi:lysophospholipase L1-like esterase|uniref:GDSL-type esterase/lipase family protein n=1 Tax=Clostridium aromativorans TaxID=2836848 RepID=A0ABS8N1Y0_9CLOT|nr:MULTISPECIES: GDSL-type esterase/lipase family protein [Clostridium]KAA8668422.1 hydrolase [Clostridium sp. HV4-5-A1G]MCC9293788.1 GDSL-type esterase/lipase family protein [Clostridium aromativorans]CAB1240943.1 Hydrolase [Clostridiaceae bacterium BL-3]